jgi:hypothetical protein
MGFAGKKNGESLQFADAAGFDVRITVDKGIEHERNSSRTKLSLVILRVPSNDIESIRPHVPQILNALSRIKAGEIARVLP